MLAAILIALSMLKDPTANFSRQDQRDLIGFMIFIILTLTVIAIGSITLLYWDFGPFTTKGHSLIHSWEVVYSTLGYSEREWVDRAGLGFLVSSLMMAAYMLFAIGGALLAIIDRLETTDAETPTADVIEPLPTDAITLNGREPEAR